MKTYSQKGRIAFLLNLNAKSVTKELIKSISKLVNPKDLFLSQDLLLAEENIKKIMEHGYPIMFCGGGDGTVVSTINIMHKLNKIHKLPVPKIGVLALGTGNALARMLEAQNPIDDIKNLLEGKPLDLCHVSMVENEEGKLTPFAGLGYDGEIMYDFSRAKDSYFNSPFRKIFSSLLGFTAVGVFKTLPRQFNKKSIFIKVKTNHPCYQIVNHNLKDEEIFLSKEQVLFSGHAALVSVGTIKSVGYDFKLFPFAEKRPSYMHLRICAAPLLVCLLNLKKAWDGTFRHPLLYDFLVKDVLIESDTSIHYQFAGDPLGKKNKLYFKVANEPILMVKLKKEKKFNINQTPLLTRIGTL